MCKQCELKPVYEFTNKRKLCRRCFIKYFQKKVLYTIRKFKMIRDNDVVCYEIPDDFRGVVLEDVLKMFVEKGAVSIIKLPARSRSQIGNKQLIEKFFINNFKKSRAKRAVKIAVTSTIDIEADKIIKEIIKGKVKDLDKVKPVEERIIKPLYLFLDEEVLLYAKLKKLKFKRIKEKGDKITKFVDDLEKKHPEVKRAVVNSWLEIAR